MTDHERNEPESTEGTPPPDPAATPPATGVGAPADVGTRFLARLIDHVLVGIVTFAIIVPIFIGAMFAGAGMGMFGGFDAGSILSSLVSAALIIGYFAVMESQTGQTVGKMLLGLKTESPNGGNPSFEETLKRNGWYALGIIPWLGGLATLGVAIYIAVTINSSPTHTGWHDEFAGGTRVIKTK